MKKKTLSTFFFLSRQLKLFRQNVFFFFILHHDFKKGMRSIFKLQFHWQISQSTLTCWLLHVHHQGLEGEQGLKLLLLITKVFLQQTGSLIDLWGVHLVRVVTWREQQHRTRNLSRNLTLWWDTTTFKGLQAQSNRIDQNSRWDILTDIQIMASWHTDVIKALRNWFDAACASSKLA